jgi:O-antigen ligase
MLAEFLQLPDAPGATGSHQSSTTIWLIRAPLTFLAALLLLVKPSFARLTRRDLRLWYLFYAAFFTLSMAWSTSVLATAGKAFEIVIAILIIIQASKGGDALRRLEGMYRLTLLLGASLGLVTVLGFFTGSSYFRSDKVGIFMSHTAYSPFYSGNGLGVLSIALLLVVFAEWQIGGLSITRAFPQVLFSIGIFMFSSSRTSLAILLLGVCFVFLRRSKWLLVGFTITVGGLLYAFRSAILNRLSEHEAQSNLDNLSGRTVMWAAAIKDWKKQPWLGYGGGVGGKYVLAHIGNSALEVLSNLHNGFLECLTGLGIFGFLLSVSIFLICTFRVLRMWKRYPAFAGLYIWIVSIWIDSMMGMGALAWMDYRVVIYLILIAQTDILRKQDPRFNPFMQQESMEDVEKGIIYA